MDISRCPPKKFIEIIRLHNRRALMSSFLCLLGTVFCWGLGWFIFNWLTIFILSTIYGEAARSPKLLHYYYIGILVILYVWATLDRISNRFPEVQDRTFLGWKEYKDVLLGLPRMTFGIFGNLHALVLLSRSEKKRAWTLLYAIFESEERATFNSLAFHEPNVRVRMSLLNVLQIIGIVDLHISRDEDFFYLVRSNQIDWLSKIESIDNS